jgi:sialic acid synthase SpsE
MNKVEIIAEIAQGFEGNEKLSQLLTKGAISTKADAVKFQLVIADELATAEYEHYPLFKSLEMLDDVWLELCSSIQKHGMKVYFDVFGLSSLDIAYKLNANGVKLSTTEFYNNKLFDAAVEKFDKVFLSVGGIPVEDIDKKLLDLNEETIAKICLMYGFQAEPTPLDQNNLNKLKLLKERFPQFEIGFMDHSDGGTEDAFYLPLIALGVGVNVIEKHITLDRNLEIEDFVSGLSPVAFSKFVTLIRKYEPVFGNVSLALTPLEEKYRNKATKSVVALRDFNVGETIEEQDVALKRTSKPLNEQSILVLESVIGKVVLEKVDKDVAITRGQV